MLRKRAEKLDEIIDELWSEVCEENRDLVDEFFELNSQFSKTTVKQYTSGLKQWFYWVHMRLNDKKMFEITKKDFARYRSFLFNHGLASSSIKFKISAVSTLCNYIENMLVDEDSRYKMFRNFTKGFPPIPANKVYNKVKITKEEFEEMMSVLEQQEDLFGMTWLGVAFNTGARRAELIQFKSEIVDYPLDGKNYVLSHIVRGKGSGFDGKPLEYMINKEALKYIKIWLEKRGFEHECIFAKKIGDEIKVISEEWADNFCQNKLSYILGRRINPHLFKASCVTHLLEQGIDIALVSKFIAHHEDVSTTIKHYDLRDFTEEKNKIFI